MTASIGSLSMTFWSMSTCAVGSRSASSSVCPVTSTDVVAPARLSAEIQLDRHAGPHVDVARERLEALGGHLDVIGVWRQIAEHELSQRRRSWCCA